MVIKMHIAVVGAGAAGLMAAYQAAETLLKMQQPVHVTVLEGNKRAGKKLLATGNGRCNLTNMHVSSANYHGDKAAAEILSCVSVSDILAEFEKIGILCRTDEAGRVYPYNLQAAAVLKALHLACEEKGVTFVYEFNVFSILHTAAGLVLKSESGEEITADKCVIATGGSASPGHSCGGNGYALAKQAGHSLTPLSPALTPVLCKEKVFSALKGMRCKAKVTLEGDGHSYYEESGEIIFAEKSLSGICIFNLSMYLADYFRFGQIDGKKIQQFSIVLDLAEDKQIDQLTAYFSDLCHAHPNRSLGDLLAGFLNIKVGEELLKSLGFNRSRSFSTLQPAELLKIAQTIKAWRFSVTALPDWDKAQVTAGGIPLAEIQLPAMQSRKMPNLYFAGEILDVHGECGGYNLNFAWATGILAGKAAAKNTIIL